MALARNFAIIALLALAVAFLPSGGEVADALIAALTMGFLAAIAWAVHRAALANRLTLTAMPESRRIVLMAAAGMVVLLVAGASRMFETGPATLAWLALLGSAVIAIWLVVSEARSG